MGDLLQFQLLAEEAENLCFLKRYDKTYKDFPWPCRTNVYKILKSSDQTNTCAEMAARFYYNKLYPGRFLNDLEVMDSHTFDRTKYDDIDDDEAYYHVNFRARILSRANPLSMFFAELTGIEGPEKVKMCIELDEGEMDNCIFCTGIWHPGNGFVGCMGPHTKKHKLFLAGDADSIQDAANSSQLSSAVPKPMPEDHSRKHASAESYKLPKKVQANPLGELQNLETPSARLRPPHSSSKLRRPRPSCGV